jgi:DedD protein
MASGRKGQSEITLGAGHVAGMFLAVLVLCGIFFTLGYVMGRGGSPRKSSVAGARSTGIGGSGNSATGSGAPAATGWDFFPQKSSSNGSSVGATPGLTSQPASSATAEAPARSGPISMPARPVGVRIDSKPPVLPDGHAGVLLQVAAMTNRSDALSLAGFLKQKGYPAFAWGPSPDRLYRVQVGPYGDSKAAGAARVKLEKEGFQSILKK